MAGSEAHAAMLARLVAAARADPRIAGLVDYGSTSDGRGDEWSDVDVAVFVRDGELEAFEREWKAWAGQFGELLLAYTAGVGHPWAVYEAEPIPLRVDFAFFRQSQVEDMLTWPKAPASVEAMVLYDSSGRVSEVAGRMIGRSLAPGDVQATFETVCGDFWYYALRTMGKLQRNQEWAARWEFNFIVAGNLLSLLRLEAGAIARWRAQSAGAEVDSVVSPARLAELQACIPGPGRQEVWRALARSADLAREVCTGLAGRHGWPWPERLAERTIEILGDYDPFDGWRGGQHDG